MGKRGEESNTASASEQNRCHERKECGDHVADKLSSLVTTLLDGADLAEADTRERDENNEEEKIDSHHDLVGEAAPVAVLVCQGV